MIRHASILIIASMALVGTATPSAKNSKILFSSAGVHDQTGF